MYRNLKKILIILKKKLIYDFRLIISWIEKNYCCFEKLFLIKK